MARIPIYNKLTDTIISNAVEVVPLADGARVVLPNLFTQNDIDIVSFDSRYVDGGTAQVTLLSAVNNDVPCWNVQTGLNTTQSCVADFPVSALGSMTTFIASLRVLGIDTATGGSGNRDVLLQISQRDSSRNLIGGTLVSVTLAGPTGLSIPTVFSCPKQTVVGSAAYIRFTINNQNTNGTQVRNCYFHQPLMAPGANPVFRRPVEFATPAQAITGTDTRKPINSSVLASALSSVLTPVNNNIMTNTSSINTIIEALVSQRIETPAGLGWPDQYPIYCYKTPTSYKVLVTDDYLRNFVDSRIWSVTPYYVDASRVDNSGDGLSWATAKRDINAAITLANSDVQAAIRIFVKTAVGNAYFQSRSINGSSGTVEPTKPIALIADGGRVRHWAGTTETSWVNDGSGTSTFTGGPSSASRVFDRINLTADGDYTELTNVADQATVRTTSGSWTDIGSTLAIKRSDGLTPTVDNTLIVRNITTAAFQTCTSDIYIEGFDFEGGPFGGLWIDPVATRNVVLNNCTAKYAGTSVNQLDGFRIRRTKGLVLLYNCTTSNNWKDGFNYHTDNSGGIMYVLQIGCLSNSTGKSPSLSNNGFTTHDDVVAIDINGSYTGSLDGAVFHVIETTKTWAVGTTVTSVSIGDTNKAAFKASDTAQLWLEGTTATTPGAGDYCIYAQGPDSTVYKRNHISISGIEFSDVGADITTF